MKTPNLSDEDLKALALQAIRMNPNASLSALREKIPGRSSRVTEVINSLLTKEELKRRKVYSKIQSTKIHELKVLPLILEKYVNIIELSIEELAKQHKIRTQTASKYIQLKLGEKQFQRVSALKRSYHKTTGKSRIVITRKNGAILDGHGYILIPTPLWLKRQQKYTYEHQVVMLKKLGLEMLPKDFVIHHINEDKTDNNLNNLVLLTNSAHMYLHTHSQNISNKLTLWEYEEFMIWKSKQTTAI